MPSIAPGAIEKQKLVYILNRDASANLTISSPLEAHKSNTFVYSCAVRCVVQTGVVMVARSGHPADGARVGLRPVRP